MAGESAAEAARRRREKAARLARQADLFEQGAEGERATAAALALLAPEAWRHIHDVRWPGRRFANIDHIAIGPPGVFVIDSKNWSGSVTVDGQTLRQNGRSRETAVASAADAGLAVSELLPAPYSAFVSPVLCFVRQEQMSGWARDVMICSTGNLTTMMLTRTPVMAPEHVAWVHTVLSQQMASAVGVAGGHREGTTTALVGPVHQRVAPQPPSTQRVGRPTRHRRKKSALPGVVRVLVLLVLGYLVLRHFDLVADTLGDWHAAAVGAGRTS